MEDANIKKEETGLDFVCDRDMMAETFKLIAKLEKYPDTDVGYLTSIARIFYSAIEELMITKKAYDIYTGNLAQEVYQQSEDIRALKRILKEEFLKNIHLEAQIEDVNPVHKKIIGFHNS